MNKKVLKTIELILVNLITMIRLIGAIPSFAIKEIIKYK